MDRLNQINQILDSCLTTEILNQVYPLEKRLEEKNLPKEEVYTRHRWAQIMLLEKVGTQVESGIQETLKGRELVQVCNRLDRYLISSGFLIKPTF
jgi:hypothetical protein